MSRGFTIKCENCGKELSIGTDEFYKHMLFYAERDYDRNVIEISCNCGNEMKDI